MIRSVVLSLSFVLCATHVWAGANPVNPSSDAAISVPTISAEVGTNIVAFLGQNAGTNAVSTSAIATINQSAGTPDALVAIESLSVSIADSVSSGSLVIPSLTQFQETQAVAIIDQLIASLTASGLSGEALASIRAAIVKAQN